MTTATDPQVIAAITADLKAFGYTRLTEKQVKEQIKMALRGEQTTAIGVLAVEMLKKAGLWPGDEP
jgi:hypothetical protein